MSLPFERSVVQPVKSLLSQSKAPSGMLFRFIAISFEQTDRYQKLTTSLASELFSPLLRPWNILTSPR